MKALKNRDADGELLTYAQTATRSNLGLNTTMTLARESGALIRIGRTVRVDWPRFIEYIRKNYVA